jgi:hypothetical protein
MIGVKRRLSAEVFPGCEPVQAVNSEFTDLALQIVTRLGTRQVDAVAKVLRAFFDHKVPARQTRAPFAPRTSRRLSTDNTENDTTCSGCVQTDTKNDQSPEDNIQFGNGTTEALVKELLVHYDDAVFEEGVITIVRGVDDEEARKKRVLECLMTAETLAHNSQAAAAQLNHPRVAQLRFATDVPNEPGHQVR